MKRIFLMATAAVVAMTMSSCSKEDQTEINASTTSMTLSASVDQQSDTKATIGGDSNWQFSFETGDEVKVTNSAVLSSSTYYTFTKGESKFTSSDAQPTSEEADWYAFFPGTITLTGQTGTKDNAADHFGYAGKQEGVAEGTTNLSMTLSPQMAVLEIENWYGTISISAKTGDKYVTGMTAAVTSGTPSYSVNTSSDESVLLSADDQRLYYIAVPAGVALSFYNSGVLLYGKNGTTSEFTLVAGKHYRLTVGTAPTGFKMVEYLESTGVQYINSGLLHNDLIVEYNACTTSKQANSQVFLATAFGSNWVGWKNGGLPAANNTINGIDGTQFREYKVTYTTNNIVLLDVATGKSITTTNGNYNNELRYFGWGDSTYPPYAKLTYIKFSNSSSTILQNLIPAVRTSDTKPGMYDLVTNTFFVNQNSGDDFSYPTN